MDRVSRSSLGPEGLWRDHRIESLPFTDNVLLFFLRHGAPALGWFTAESEAAGMKISSSETEDRVFHWEKETSHLQAGGESIPKVEECRRLWCRRLAAAGMQSVYHPLW